MKIFSSLCATLSIIVGLAFFLVFSINPSHPTYCGIVAIFMYLCHIGTKLEMKEMD